MSSALPRLKPWRARDIDPLMLGLVALNALGAMLIGWQVGELPLAVQAALACAALAGACVLGGRGR
ncbi:MAG: hypothetical protein Q7U26_17980, partial [Aquabacterium sp.]|nr:hypothetical protein [Aquabacterium sp.]